MKKLVPIILSLLFFINIQAQNTKFTYNFDDFQIQNIDSYQLIVLPNSQQLAKVGEPCLPFVSVSLLLPPQKISKKIEYIFEEKTKINGNFNLYPKQHVRPFSSDETNNFMVNEQIYEQTQYPENRNSDVTTKFMNGYGFAFSTFTPFEYNPSTGELFLYKKVTVVVEYKNDKSNSIINLSSRPQVVQRIENLAQNPQVIDQYPVKKSNDDYELLLITTSSYSGSFASLVELYLQRGIRTQITTLTEITSSTTGIDNAEKVRNFIIQEYQNHDILYVMLAGDADLLPYRGMYCSVQSSSVYEDDNIPADVYFSALDGNWNDDGDNLWGEPNEDDIPDIAVGRLPFSNATELSYMINKIIQYTTNPVTSTSELSNPLLAGEHLWSDPQTWGADYLDLLIGYQNENGYATNGINTNYTTMYEREGTWDGSGDAIMAAMNSGYSFVHHVGHANSDFMMGLYTDDVTNSNFSQLNGVNHNYALIYSHGCICGAFDGDCVSERFVKIQNGAVGVFTNSRYGWFNEGQTEGPSAHLHREFVDALYNDKQNNAGDAEMISKIMTYSWLTNPEEWEPGAQRWCYYDHNALTDPTLPIWTDNPYDFSTVYDNEIPIGADFTATLSSSKSPMENYTCVIIQNGQMVGKALTNASGQAVIFIDPSTAQVGSATLYVSGYNIIMEDYPVTITEASSAVLSLYSFAFIDGDNNLVDYNEQLYINLQINNYGLEDATNVVLTLSSDDENIVVLQAVDNLGTVASSGSSLSENILQLQTGYVHDQYNSQLNLSISSDQYSTVRTIPITVNAPKIEINNVTVTEVSGNGNGILEANETGNISFEYKNTGHSVSPEINSLLVSENEYITILTSSDSFSSVSPNGTFTVSSDFSIGDGIVVGELVDFTCQIDANIYSSNCQIAIYFGSAVEDFETGDFTKFDWDFQGDLPWTITNSGVYQGSYSAKSGTIQDDQTSTLKIEIEIMQDGDISFFKKVSCEDDPYYDNWDYLKFEINGEEQGRWDGEVAWSSETYPLSAGNHTLEWTYNKDISVSDGSDCAWIDNIQFPPMGSMIFTNDDKPEFVTDLKVFPNPFNSFVYFDFNTSENKDCYIFIYDLSGKTVFSDKFSSIAGKNTYLWNSYNNDSGVYLYKIVTENQMFMGKIIKQ